MEKETFREYFVSTFYFVLSLNAKHWQFKIKRGKMNLYRIEHMYFPFSVIIDFLLNVDHFKRYVYFLLAVMWLHVEFVGLGSSSSMESFAS